MDVKVTIHWGNISDEVRHNIVTNTINLFGLKALDQFRSILLDSGGIYDGGTNTVTFASENHYTLFLLKWSN
jgi:hypothetical protein